MDKNEQYWVDSALQAMRQFIGKKLKSVSQSSDGDYIRWTFEDGGYQEWYVHLYREAGNA
jgi:hypothetical protein